MTQTATATAPTQFASRYLQQLCKHWSHKAEVSFTPDKGSITFENGNKLDLTAFPDHLALSANVPDDADLGHFQAVVDRHLIRFAFRETLSITWGAQA